MPHLTIVATIKAKADQVEIMKAELEKMVALTRAEDGCVQYDLHQDNDDPSRFLFYENWQSRDHWQRHMASEHLQAYQQATADAVEEITIFEMTRIA